MLYISSGIYPLYPNVMPSLPNCLLLNFAIHLLFVAAAAILPSRAWLWFPYCYCLLSTLLAICCCLLLELQNLGRASCLLLCLVISTAAFCCLLLWDDLSVLLHFVEPSLLLHFVVSAMALSSLLLLLFGVYALYAQRSCPKFFKSFCYLYFYWCWFLVVLST